jgi:hypothetical protein
MGSDGLKLRPAPLSSNMHCVVCLQLDHHHASLSDWYSPEEAAAALAWEEGI